jgi:hypothetical protein
MPAVSEQAHASCGRHTSQEKWDWWGLSTNRRQPIRLPLVHISFKIVKPIPVPAKGIISIGQFGMGPEHLQFG